VQEPGIWLSRGDQREKLTPLAWQHTL